MLTQRATAFKSFSCVLWLVLVLTSGPFLRASAHSAERDPVGKSLINDVPASNRIKPEVREILGKGPIDDVGIQAAMQDRDYPKAIALLDKAISKKKANTDYLLYLKGRALHLSGKYDEAIAEFDRFAKDFPNSTWSRRVEFAKALSLAKKGDFKAAELIYRAQAEYLLSDARKAELADIYLEFADEQFKPKEKDKKPDYAQALQFYKKALEMVPEGEKRIQAEFRVARCHQELKDGNNQAEAIKGYREFIEKHREHALDVEALFRLGEVCLTANQKGEARKAWQDLLAKYGKVEESEESEKSEQGKELSPRVAEAAYRMAKTWSFPTPANVADLNLGVGALETFLKRFPEHESAGAAYLEIAQAYLHFGRHEDAVGILKRFLENKAYEDRKEIADARGLLGQCYLRQGEFDAALKAFGEYLAKHPAHHAWAHVQRQIIDTEFLKAEAAFTKEKYDEAKNLWEAFLAKYPLDGRNPEIFYRIGYIAYKKEAFDAAVRTWGHVTSKYPKTNEASKSLYMIGRVLEEELGKYDEALAEYRKIDFGSHVGPARQRIARLTEKRLVIHTDRVFRTDEKPTVRVVSRNIEKVNVRVYKIDMETYFRKMHQTRGVERLDVALIDPDKSFTYEIPKYVKYAKTEENIPIPIPEADAPGAVAVTVSGETLEATTLLLRSDLDVVVKTSRDEAFVFAENMRTGKPWPEAKLLLSDGSKVFAEVKTGKDGVFRKSFKELKQVGDIRVFALTGGHTASNVVGLQGISPAAGVTDKGYLFTERPAYRAGQMVHVRGWLRRAVKDVLTVEKGKKYELSVFDPRNRILMEESVTLGEFGGFATHFVLPPTSPQGEYRLVLRDAAEKTFQGNFRVVEYTPEPIRIDVDTPQWIYHRGEKIEGTIKAEYYHGGPVAGEEVRYRLANGRWNTAQTNEKGEVAFSLETREFSEGAVAVLDVVLPRKNLQRQKSFIIALQGFSIAMETVRDVYVSGESFDLILKTKDAKGEPVGRKLEVKVFERTNIGGRQGERLVETHKIESNAKSGEAAQTLALKKGGRYVLRAVGTDRFGNPISAEKGVTISGEEDTVRLRILADRHNYKVGETAKVRLLWREAPALALVTYQGARILDYRLEQLAQGENILEIPMGAKLAPNFDLAVAVMTDAKKKDAKRFHTASSPFDVRRELVVKLETKRLGEDGKESEKAKDPVRPGDEVEVTVTATDPQGNPVAAELSLAMVEQSLLDRFPSALPAVQEFFRGTRRQSSVRTESSVTFAYHPRTARIAATLLEERERLATRETEEGRIAEITEGGIVAKGHIEVPMEAAAPGGRPIAAAVRDSATGRFMLGVGVNSDAGLVDSIVLDEKNLDPAQLRAYSGRRSGAMKREAKAAPRPGEPMSQAATTWSAHSRKRFSHATDSEYSFFTGFTRGSSRGREEAGRQAGDFYLGASVSSIKGLAADNRRGFVALDGSGVMRNYRLGDKLDAPATDELVRALQESGSVLLPQADSHETGYWNPTITTDESGKATVTFVMPERSTAWRLVAKGISKDTLAGENESTLQVKKRLFAQMTVPTALVRGDKARIPVEVHHGEIKADAVEVLLKTTIGDKTTTLKKAVETKEAGLHTVEFEVAVDPEKDPTGTRSEAVFELSVSAKEADGTVLTDVARRNVPVRPYGLEVFAAAGGSASSDATAWVEPPKDLPFHKPSLEILVGPSVRRSLFDIIAAPAPLCQIQSSRIASGLETSSSDLMAALALSKMAAGSRDFGSPLVQSLDGRIRAGVGLFVSSQNDDGGWNWSGRTGPSNPFATARAFWALSLAADQGYRVPDDALAKAAAYLKGAIAKTANNDYESKAVLLHALTAGGHADFALANRIHRDRASLSRAALAHLALVFAEMDRKETAKELLGAMPKSDAKTPRSCLPWNASDVEIDALCVLAAMKAGAADSRIKPLVDGILAKRTGHRWTPDKATGPAAMALCGWFGKKQYAPEKYTLAIAVNDKPVTTLEIDADALTRSVQVPAECLVKGKQRITFSLTGRGQYTYQCILGGFVPAEELKSVSAPWELRKYVEPAPLEVDGKEIRRGFDCLTGSHKTFRNSVTQLPVGKSAVVEIQAWRHGIRSETPQESIEYLVLTEPIPAGTAVVEGSVQGGYERYEITPEAIVFYIGNRPHFSPIRYRLRGVLPGEYRIEPPVLRDAHRPERMRVGPVEALTVIPADAKSADEYRLTPRELFELGKHYFDKKDYKQAAKHLGELVENWRLQPEIYKESITMLLDCRLELGPAEEVVRCFEIVKEKWPATEIAFEKIVKVGAAYHDMGEFERSYLVFRATVEAGFMSESGVAGFLEQRGEFLRSVEVMNRLLANYPPEPYLAEALVSLAQRIYSKAETAAADPKLKEAKITRVDLVRRAWRMLEQFLTAYPDDPAADQAAFSAAGALLELKAYDQAREACEAYAKRYPKSDLLDGYWYIIGYCHFASGEHEQAVAMCRKVDETKRTDKKTGREVDCPNKWQAVYILGQVYNSLDRPEDAIREYRRVEDRFLDAKEAIEYFLHKDIRLPEVTTIKPGEKPALELAFRNIAECDVKLYRIDLMKYSLLKRNLGGVARINLSGIRPFHEATIKLGDGKDYRDRTHKLPLPIEKEGAYLIVCRGDDLHAGGLALLSPLSLEVHEDATTGRVRATVKDAVKGVFLRDVHVKAIGTRNDKFFSGETDLRGVFTTEGVSGKSTVIAFQDPGRYAFFRGETELGPQVPAPNAPAAKKPQSAAVQTQIQGGMGGMGGGMGGATQQEAQLLQNVIQSNRAIQQRQGQNMERFYYNNKRSIEVNKALKK